MFRDRSQAAERDIPALTTLRAIGALWVVCYHFDNELRFFRTSWIEAGYLGVDLFFVLSGFVIAYSHADDFVNGIKGWQSFLVARLARIYPMHLFSLLVLLAMYGAARSAGIPLMPSEYTARDFLLNLLLLQAWGLSDHLSWNYPSWTISTEWFVYLCFPLVAMGLSRIRSRREAWTGWLVSFSAITLVAAVRNDGSLDLLNGWSLLRGGCEFLMGAMLFVVYRFDPRPSLGWSRTAVLSAFAGLIWFQFRTSDFVYPAIFSIVIFAAARARGALQMALSFRPVVYLGEISYSIYMTHILFRKLVVRWVHLEVGPDANLAIRLTVFGLCVALSLLVAALCYHGVENPARTALRRLSGRQLEARA
jgi:peptidoglycan/LPS O-acetylase OafA/YrhL